MKLKLLNLGAVGMLSVVLSGCLEKEEPNDGSGGGTPPTTVTINIGDGSVTEGDSGTNDVVFNVSISASTSDNVTFEYATTDGTATAGADYAAASGTMTIPAGSTSGDITVSVLGDTDDENLETFSVSLSNPSSNAQLGDATGVMEIIDNDGAAPATVTLSISDASVTEGDSGTSDVTFTVSVDSSTGDNVTFEYATSDGTATAGADYTAVSGSATIPAGSTSTGITVSILGDTDVESLETFSVTLSNPSSNAQLGDATAVMEIVDNDTDTPPPVGGTFPGVPEYSFRAQLPDLGDSADVTSCSENGTTVNGTVDDWVVVTLNQNGKCEISGSYYVVQNSTINARLAPSGGPYAIRNNEIDSPGSGGALVPSGTDVLVESNTIHNNGVIPSDPDHHGMNVRGNSERLWILSNLIYENSGDAIQFCHGCVGGVHDGPIDVYIAGNVMHDDEENAIDLKEFVGPVVAVCNEMYGYERGQFSGNGEAVRINDEGQQGEVWFAHNNYHDNLRDIAPYSSDAEGYFLDENTSSVNNSNSNSVIVNGAAAQQYYDQFEAQYGLDLSAACPAP